MTNLKNKNMKMIDMKVRKVSYEYEHRQLFALCMFAAALILLILIK